MEISNVNIQNNSFDFTYPKKACNEEIERTGELSAVENSKFEPHKDRYVSHEEDPSRAQGIYKMSADKDGKPKVIFEAPKNSYGGNNKKVNENQSKESRTAQCTGSTDKVDSEIKRLKNRKQQLERRINNTTEEEAEKLRQQVAQINRELMQKDNDSYRRQNTVFTQY